MDDGAVWSRTADLYGAPGKGILLHEFPVCKPFPFRGLSAFLL